jgi:hypothetical protein
VNHEGFEPQQARGDSVQSCVGGAWPVQWCFDHQVSAAETRGPFLWRMDSNNSSYAESRERHCDVLQDGVSTQCYVYVCVCVEFVLLIWILWVKRVSLATNRLLRFFSSLPVCCMMQDWDGYSKDPSNTPMFRGWWKVETEQGEVGVSCS